MDSYSNEDRLNVPSCNPFANMLNNVSSWSSMKYSCDTWKGWSADGLFSLNDQYFERVKKVTYPSTIATAFKLSRERYTPVSQSFSCSGPTIEVFRMSTAATLSSSTAS